MKSYSEKLKDPRWQKKRLQILERDGWLCQFCGENKKTLHVHHLTYSPSGEPWDVSDINLMTLCEDCHEYETLNRKEFEHDLCLMLRQLKFPGHSFSELLQALNLCDVNFNDTFSDRILIDFFAAGLKMARDKAYKKEQALMTKQNG